MTATPDSKKLSSQSGNTSPRPQTATSSQEDKEVANALDLYWYCCLCSKDPQGVYWGPFIQELYASCTSCGHERCKKCVIEEHDVLEVACS